jgi:uroporphyrin-III C-methyltransferase
MGVESLTLTTKELLDGGLKPSTPVAIIERGTSKYQRTITGTLGSIAKEAEEQKVQPPAVIVVGEVVTLGRKLSWFKPS